MRATGSRLPYGSVPEPVRAWVSALAGAVSVVQEHRGGMSPGCATSLRAADGRLLFVKAVGAELNPQTVALFRYEAAILPVLPPVPYRPGLLAGYDRDGWAALLLEHADGRPPDFADPADRRAVADVVTAQVGELTPPPAGAQVLPLAETVRRWVARWSDVQADPAAYLPGWAAVRTDELAARVRRLPDRLGTGTLCHFDIRDDNLLIRPDGSAVILDWGMARLGPPWVDPLLLALQVGTAAVRDHLGTLGPADREVAVDLLTAFGGSQSWNARQPARPGLPHYSAYCAADAARLLTAARAVLVNGG
jgi:hypothetical protein